MYGIYEVIALALALGGFGVQANPKAPSADVVLEYAVDDADVIAYVDAVPLIPGNYSALKKLPDAPEIKGSPALKDVVGKVIAEVEGARGMVKAAVGVDLTTDLSSATIFVKMSQPPELVMVARGKFPADMPTRIGKMMGGKAEVIGDAQLIAVSGGSSPFEVLAVSKGGVLFAGSRKLVTARLASTWKSPARPKGSILEKAAKLLRDKPVYMVAASFSSGRIKTQVEASAGKDDAAILDRFAYIAGAMFHNGLGWVIEDKNAKGHARSVMASDGAIDLMRAAHLAPRGFAKLILSFVDDIKSKDPGLEEVKKHKGDILKIVDQFTGDGKFKVKTDADAKAFRVSVRATGKKVSDVLPVGLIIPGLWVTMMKASKAPTSTSSGTTVKPVAPRPSGGITAPPKPTPKKPAPKKP
jgi:hypothetical protein